MNYRAVCLAALTLAVGACAQDASDDERTARETGDERTGEQMARDESARSSDYGTAEAGRPEPGASQDEAAGASGFVGKLVVDGDGQLLGSTRRIVREAEGQEKLAVIEVSGASAARRQEVVVPLNALETGSVPGKLEIGMSREELLKQPDATEGDYVDLETWKPRGEAETDTAATSRPREVTPTG